MALPTAFPVSLSQVKTEFTGPNNLSAYLLGGTYVPSDTVDVVPPSPSAALPLSLASFLGAAKKTWFEATNITLTQAAANVAATYALPGQLWTLHTDGVVEFVVEFEFHAGSLAGGAINQTSFWSGRQVKNCAKLGILSNNTLTVGSRQMIFGDYSVLASSEADYANDEGEGEGFIYNEATSASAYTPFYWEAVNATKWGRTAHIGGYAEMGPTDSVGNGVGATAGKVKLRIQCQRLAGTNNRRFTFTFWGRPGKNVEPTQQGTQVTVDTTILTATLPDRQVYIIAPAMAGSGERIDVTIARLRFISGTYIPPWP